MHEAVQAQFQGYGRNISLHHPIQQEIVPGRAVTETSYHGGWQMGQWGNGFEKGKNMCHGPCGSHVWKSRLHHQVKWDGDGMQDFVLLLSTWAVPPELIPQSATQSVGG